MSSLLTRTVSALIAVLVIFLIYYFFDVLGLKLLSAVVAFLAAFELTGILFPPNSSKFNRFLFYSFLVLIFLLSTLFPQHAAVIFSFFAICFCLMNLLMLYKFENLSALTTFQGKSILGFFYMGLLPSFALRILDLPHGLIWFLTLLIVVFAGDIGGYCFGRLMGKTPLMPLISPKKTVEGAIGGLSFSLVAAGICSIKLPHVPFIPLLVLSLSASVVAQFGDLFESLLKRVADVKDSGTIMPGHGGILDRIDGVLFASPVMMFGALIFEKVF